MARSNDAMSATLGLRRFRRVNLFSVRKDERDESDDISEFNDEVESAQFARAQRAMARSKRVAIAPRRPPARRNEVEEAVKDGLREETDSGPDV